MCVSSTIRRCAYRIAAQFCQVERRRAPGLWRKIIIIYFYILYIIKGIVYFMHEPAQTNPTEKKKKKKRKSHQPNTYPVPTFTSFFLDRVMEVQPKGKRVTQR